MCRLGNRKSSSKKKKKEALMGNETESPLGPWLESFPRLSHGSPVWGSTDTVSPNHSSPTSALLDPLLELVSGTCKKHRFKECR